MTLQYVQVGAADAAGLDPDERRLAGRRRSRDRADTGRRSGSVKGRHLNPPHFGRHYVAAGRGRQMTGSPKLVRENTPPGWG